MQIKQVEIFAVRLPLRTAFRSSTGEVDARELGVVRLTDEDGRIGLGEVTPYPDRGAPNLAQELAQFDAGLSRWLRQQAFDDQAPTLPTDASPPVLAALDTALLDLRARRSGLRVAELLGAEDQFEVPVNTTITAREPEVVAELARRARDDGYTTVKLKVGHSASDEVRLAALRDAIGFEMLVRLDANGSWSGDQALDQVSKLEDYGLELIEQPVASDDLEAMRRVRDAASVPIVADEGVRTLNDLEVHRAAGACDGIAVKLSQSGGPSAAAELIKSARLAGMLVFVTSTLDGPVGLAAGLHLAAAKADFGLANGLATGELLARSYANGLPPVKRGVIAVADAPGLGIELDEDALSLLALH